MDEEKQVIGRTPWDVIAENSKFLIIIVVFLISLAIAFILTGLAKYDDGKLLIGRGSQKTTLTTDDNLSAITQIGSAKNQNYILEDVFLNVQVEKTDTGFIKYCKTIYKIRALKDFSDNFVETYSGPNKIQHVMGSDQELPKSINDQSYDIPLHMKKNEVKTIMTGANMLSQTLSITSPSEFVMKPNGPMDFYSYPNSDDYISDLTIHIESNSLDIKGFARNAVKQDKNSTISYGDSYNADYKNFNTSNRSITFHWHQLLPGEFVGLAYAW
ncbi:hypothetical protein ACFGVR_17770 [Mucilaginibacter sp. AW1-3]